VIQFRRLLRLESGSSRLSYPPAIRRAFHSAQQQLSHLIRMMAPVLLALSFASVAHAQGTMDFSGAQTLMGTFKTVAMYAGAVICLGGLIFAGIRMMSGRFQDAIPGLFGALFGAGVLGWGAGWIPSLACDEPSCGRRGLEDGPGTASSRELANHPRGVHASDLVDEARGQ
jgi:hypothetical protein